MNREKRVSQHTAFGSCGGFLDSRHEKARGAAREDRPFGSKGIHLPEQPFLDGVILPGGLLNVVRVSQGIGQLAGRADPIQCHVRHPRSRKTV